MKHFQKVSRDFLSRTQQNQNKGATNFLNEKNENIKKIN